ncbi:hypothetical protein CPB97_002344 [Podila verticillata]|nr:hypothetical protein CPB97_002344 [Podila verticillata]
MAHRDRDHRNEPATDPRQVANATRTRTNRPYSSSSVPTANSLLGMTNTTPTPAASSSHNTPPGSAASSIRTRRPPNAVLTGPGGTAGASSAVRSATTRPKTAYQAVTWKENLDAFNRRLRRGSLSLDATAQEEEFASQTMARAKAQQQAQYHHDQGNHNGENEQTSLLGDPASKSLGSTFSNGKAYGATGLSKGDAPEHHHNHSHHHQQPQHLQQQNGSLYEPVFPTQLNPALATTKSSKLGVFSGVFIPCVLSIWGIILFLRFGFIIGQAGVLGTMGMFVVGYAINIMTTFSLSAVSTNGTVRGPEFGGSIGVIYFFGTVIGCGMNVLGFVEPLISNFGESSGTVYRVLPEGAVWGFIYGTILLVLCTLVCLVGSKLFSRASLVLAVIILLSTLSIFVSFATMPAFSVPERNIEYTGWSWETLQENMWPAFTVTTGPDGSKESFQTVFGVLFPACIGILAGASMSGDLEDPSKSIPSGTLWAVGTTFCAYTCIVILMGGSISRSTMYTDLSVLQDVSISPLFIASGALAASVFATLGSVIGAAKILQAIARDNLLPVLSIFGQGTPRTDEPTLAVLFTYILCQFCLFLTDMNSIATFVSMITLLTFLIINLACFLLKIGSAPNFRPSFRFFHWWTAFAGMVLCAIVMGFVDLGKSLLSGLIVAVIFVWIHYWSPPKRWGDVTQSLIYHQVRKYLLRLDSRKEHVKFWRPQILLLVHHPRSEYHLIQFCNHLKKGALYVLGHVIQGDLRDVLQEYRRQQVNWLKFVDVLQIKAFVNLSVADSICIGARNLLIGTGLGGMRPNIVVMGSFNLQRYLQEMEQRQSTDQRPLSPFLAKKAPVTPLTPGFAPYQVQSHGDHTVNIPVSLPIDNIRIEKPIKITEYVSIIEDVLSLNKAVAIGYGFDRLEFPEEHPKSSWKLFNFASMSSPTSILSPSSSRRSSLHHGEPKKKKYIDLWPMQMSVAPLPFDEAPGQHPFGTKRASRDMGSSYSPMVGHSATFSENQPGAKVEANLTNFDTYTMVLQMGCILHMVPHWKENYLLRVMVFVEYKEDVEEEKQRLADLLENLRIPAEIKVMCLDGGDSETYDRLVKGEVFEYSPVESTNGFADSLVKDQSAKVPQVPYSYRELQQMVPLQQPQPKNTHSRWTSEPVLEEEESGRSGDEVPTVNKDGEQSSHEIGPYSGVAGQVSDRTRTLSSSGDNDTDIQPHHYPVFEASGPPPQRRRTISHPDPPSHTSQSGPKQAPLRVNTALSPRMRQGPVGISSAHPRQLHHSSSTGARYRSVGAPGSTSPQEIRLGTSVPLGASMNFRIAVPLPRQYFDPNSIDSESESDSISSEDDEDDYDRNDDDLVYGAHHPRSSSLGQNRTPPTTMVQRRASMVSSLSRTPTLEQQRLQQQQLQQQQPTQQSQIAPTSIGSHSGLGIGLGLPTVHSEPNIIGHPTPTTLSSQSISSPQGQLLPQKQQPYTLPYQHHQQPSSSSLGIGSSNPWATDKLSISPPNSVARNDLSSSPAMYDWSREVIASAAAAANTEQGPPIHSSLSSTATATSEPTSTLGQQRHTLVDKHGHEGEASQRPEEPYFLDYPEASPASPVPAVPVQFDHLGPEAQLMILNELMRIHSSPETTSIVLTTMPAPEPGTCLHEESSYAYLENLDVLMDQLEVPVLLIHAKSLTVTMTL